MKSMFKINRGGFNVDQLIRQNGMVDPSGNGAGMSDFFKKLMMAAGINHIVQVNDCETAADWTESDNGTLDVTAAATGKRVGTNCVSITNTAATDNTQYVETLYVDESAKMIEMIDDVNPGLDWRDTDYVGFWTHAESSAHFGTSTELYFALLYNDDSISEKQAVGGCVTTVHQWVEVDISGLTRTGIKGIRFYAKNSNAAEVAYVDDIIRYKLSYNGAPLYGCNFPIKSATTLTEKDIVKWTIDGLEASASAASVADLGICHLGAATLTGNATRSNFAMIPGVYIVLVQAGAATVAGEGLEWGAANKVVGVSTGADEKGMFKGLEAAGAAGDFIFALVTSGGNFIS